MTDTPERVESPEEFYEWLDTYIERADWVTKIRARDAAIRRQTIEECVSLLRQCAAIWLEPPAGSYSDLRAETIEALIEDLQALTQKAGGE